MAAMRAVEAASQTGEVVGIVADNDRNFDISLDPA